jgi:ABC-type cobalt transport system substrate-binding protein
MDKKIQGILFLIVMTILITFLFLVTHKESGYASLFFYIFASVISYFVGKNNNK